MVKKEQTTPVEKKQTPSRDSFANQDLFETLWARFIEEANFNPEAIEAEAEVVKEEILRIEERLEEKRKELEALKNKPDHAKTTLRTLLAAHLSSEAILSAMRVEYKMKGQKPTKKEADVADDLKDDVLQVLDREGQPVHEIARVTGKEIKFLNKILAALVAEGKVATQGEGRAKLFMIV